MNALIEYKKKMEIEGDGDFNQGRAKMWKTKIEAQNLEDWALVW